jgi:hypothetical protein
VAQPAHVVVSTVPEGESGSSGGGALDRESDVTAQRKLERQQRKRQGRAGVRSGVPSSVTELELSELKLSELEANLDRLRQLQHGVERRQLGPDDWALLSALIRETM